MKGQSSLDYAYFPSRCSPEKLPQGDDTPEVVISKLRLKGWVEISEAGEIFLQAKGMASILESLKTFSVAGVWSVNNSQVLLLAESSSHEQPSLPRSPNYSHGETLCLVCVSCRVQLNFQGRTDNVEFYPLILENRKDQRNPPTHLSSRRGILLLQSITILLHVT